MATFNVHLICLGCNDHSFKADYDTIKDIQSFNEHEDSCSLEVYCPMCDTEEVHCTLL